MPLKTPGGYENYLNWLCKMSVTSYGLLEDCWMPAFTHYIFKIKGIIVNPSKSLIFGSPLFFSST